MKNNVPRKPWMLAWTKKSHKREKKTKTFEWRSWKAISSQQRNASKTFFFLDFIKKFRSGRFPGKLKKKNKHLFPENLFRIFIRKLFDWSGLLLVGKTAAATPWPWVGIVSPCQPAAAMANEKEGGCSRFGGVGMQSNEMASALHNQLSRVLIWLLVKMSPKIFQSYHYQLFEVTADTFIIRTCLF